MRFHNIFERSQIQLEILKILQFYMSDVVGDLTQQESLALKELTIPMGETHSEGLIEALFETLCYQKSIFIEQIKKKKNYWSSTYKDAIVGWRLWKGFRGGGGRAQDGF